MLPSAARLKKDADFQRVMTSGERFKDGAALFFYLKLDEPAKIGVVVGKRVSPKAVVRNRYRRVIQETLRRYQSQLPPGLTVLMLLYQPDNLPGSIERAIEKWLRR